VERDRQPPKKESEPERLTLVDIADKMRATAVARGMTTKIFDQMLAESQRLNGKKK
jgi:hypothetical protein